jgi:hypothetical protein
LLNETEKKQNKAKERETKQIGFDYDQSGTITSIIIVVSYQLLACGNKCYYILVSNFINLLIKISPWINARFIKCYDDISSPFHNAQGSYILRVHVIKR